MDYYCCYTDKELHTFKYVAFVVPQPSTPTNEEHRAFSDDERDKPYPGQLKRWMLRCRSLSNTT